MLMAASCDRSISARISKEGPAYPLHLREQACCQQNWSVATALRLHWSPCCDKEDSKKAAPCHSFRSLPSRTKRKTFTSTPPGKAAPVDDSFRSSPAIANGAVSSYEMKFTPPPTYGTTSGEAPAPNQVQWTRRDGERNTKVVDLSVVDEHAIAVKFLLRISDVYKQLFPDVRDRRAEPEARIRSGPHRGFE